MANRKSLHNPAPSQSTKQTELITCEIGGETSDAFPANYTGDYKYTLSQRSHCGMPSTCQTCHHHVILRFSDAS